jgi:hypothetical protein
VLSALVDDGDVCYGKGECRRKVVEGKKSLMGGSTSMVRRVGGVGRSKVASREDGCVR